MFGLGFPELLVILVIILVIFGAGKLPQVGETLGRGLRKFRAAMDEKPEQHDPAKRPDSESSVATESEKPKEKARSV